MAAGAGAEETVAMHPLFCSGECGRQLGWSDVKVIPAVILCTHCMDHPDAVEKRLGIS